MDSTSGKHGRSGYGPTATYRRRQPAGQEQQEVPRSGWSKQEEILSGRDSSDSCCSAVSTVSLMEAQPRDVCCCQCSQVCGKREEVTSRNVGEADSDCAEESESGWTTYLLHQPDSRPGCCGTRSIHRDNKGGKPKSVLLAASSSQLQDSSSISSDASSGPVKALQEDHSSRFTRTTRKRPRTNTEPDGSLLLEDPDEPEIGAAFDAVETRLCVLQKLIPDGDRLDHEEMLDKAIEYVHSLEHRIQLFRSRILGAGVCVMPLSVLPESLGAKWVDFL